MIEQKMPNKDNYKAKLRKMSQKSKDKLKLKALERMRFGLTKGLEEAAKKGYYSVEFYLDNQVWYDRRYIDLSDIRDYCINELKLDCEFTGLMIDRIKISWGE